MACALRNWWLSVARPNGMKIAARPAAATSAAVIAPARQTRGRAQAKRSAMFVRKGNHFRENFAARVRGPYRIIIAFAGLVHNLHFIFRVASKSLHPQTRDSPAALPGFLR